MAVHLSSKRSFSDRFPTTDGDGLVMETETHDVSRMVQSPVVPMNCSFIPPSSRLRVSRKLSSFRIPMIQHQIFRILMANRHLYTRLKAKGAMLYKDRLFSHLEKMYVYNTANEVSNRLHRFRGAEFRDLKPEIFEALIHFFDKFNDLVKLFRTARDICAKEEPPQFRIMLYNNGDQMSYNAPASGTLGAIFYDSGRRSKNDFDIIIHLKDGVPQRINKLHTSYMALQFLSFFPFGDHGWLIKLKLVNDGSRGHKQLTMNMFYSSQLHDRFNLYALSPRGGQLFQQYLVNAYVSIEQNRLGYIESKKDVLRSEYLQGVHDAILKGDFDSHDVIRPYKIVAPEQVDQFISAEIPNRETHPELYKILTELMMHGPYGLANMNAPCMVDGTCSKKFPKQYEDAT